MKFGILNFGKLQKKVWKVQKNFSAYLDSF